MKEFFSQDFFFSYIPKKKKENNAYLCYKFFIWCIIIILNLLFRYYSNYSLNG